MIHFAGDICSFQADCLEGLAGGPAIRARWGAELTHLDPAYPPKSITANFLGAYLAPLNDADALESYIASPGLADRAGLAGAFLLAAQAIC